MIYIRAKNLKFPVESQGVLKSDFKYIRLSKRILKSLAALEKKGGWKELGKYWHGKEYPMSVPTESISQRSYQEHIWFPKPPSPLQTEHHNYPVKAHRTLITPGSFSMEYRQDNVTSNQCHSWCKDKEYRWHRVCTHKHGRDHHSMLQTYALFSPAVPALPASLAQRQQFPREEHNQRSFKYTPADTG